MNIEAETVRITKTKPSILVVSSNYLFDNEDAVLKFKKKLALKIVEKGPVYIKEF